MENFDNHVSYLCTQKWDVQLRSLLTSVRSCHDSLSYMQNSSKLSKTVLTRDTPFQGSGQARSYLSQILTPSVRQELFQIEQICGLDQLLTDSDSHQLDNTSLAELHTVHVRDSEKRRSTRIPIRTTGRKPCYV